MVNGLPPQPGRFMGRFSQSLLPLRGEDDSNKTVPGQKNQIEWQPNIGGKMRLEGPLRRGFLCPRVYRSERNIGYKNSNHSHDQSVTTRLSLAPSSWRGLFFCRRPRSHTDMDLDLENVIRQALGDAQAAGRDHLIPAVKTNDRCEPNRVARWT